jgi:hypothetical protein
MEAVPASLCVSTSRKLVASQVDASSVFGVAPAAMAGVGSVKGAGSKVSASVGWAGPVGGL